MNDASLTGGSNKATTSFVLGDVNGNDGCIDILIGNHGQDNQQLIRLISNLSAVIYPKDNYKSFSTEKYKNS